MSNSLNIPAVTIQSLASGVVDVSPPPAVQPILAAAPVQISDTGGNALDSTGGALQVTEFNAPNATVNSYNPTSAGLTLLAANPLRKGAIIYVNGSIPLFIKYGSGAGPASYTVEVTPPLAWQVAYYTGIITAAAPPTLTGSCTVTEIY